MFDFFNFYNDIAHKMKFGSYSLYIHLQKHLEKKRSKSMMFSREELRKLSRLRTDRHFAPALEELLHLGYVVAVVGADEVTAYRVDRFDTAEAV